MPDAVEGGLCFLVLEALQELEVLEMPEVPEVMRCVLLCMLEAIEGGLCCCRWWR